MADFQQKYPEIHRIFSPGHIIKDVHHPLIDNLNHPLFKKLIRYTDQVIFIINHTTFAYEYVSDNASDVYDRSAQELLHKTVDVLADTYHPDDLPALQNGAFPAFSRCFESLSTEEKLRVMFQYNYRVRHPKGHYFHIHQKNIALTVEYDKVILGMAICTDISAYKKDDRIFYKNTLIRDSGEKVELENNLSTLTTQLLTPREADILSLTAAGFSEKQIADQLSLSINTVKSHRKNMLKKTGVKNAAELVKFGLANFII